MERHGIENVLQPFIQDLKVLATEGVTVTIRGEERTFKGALLLCLGDNLGSKTLGGFKQSFSFSLRFCRTTNDLYKSVSNPSQLELRCDDKHLHECNLLSGPLCQHYSKTSGINRHSVLLDMQCLMVV